MTFLELCQRLRMEAGISGTGPASTSDQTGEMSEIVEWIGAAYNDIQILRPNWRFLREDFTFTTTEDVYEYTRTAAGITDLAAWITDDLRVYDDKSDESMLDYEPWPVFRAVRLFGTLQEGRPTHVSVKPNNSLILSPTPDATEYTIAGEYFCDPDELSGDSDTPIFPARYHMVIVWRALVYYAAALAAAERYEHGVNEYRRLMKAMEKSELPTQRMWEPLV